MSRLILSLYLVVRIRWLILYTNMIKPKKAWKELQRHEVSSPDSFRSHANRCTAPKPRAGKGHRAHMLVGTY